MLGECSVLCGGHIFSADTHEKDRESPRVSPVCSVMPSQVVGGPVRTPAVRVQAEMGGSSSSVPPMSPVLPLQEEYRTELQMVSPVGAVLRFTSRSVEVYRASCVDGLQAYL